MVNVLLEGHKCQDQDSNPYSADQKHLNLSLVPLLRWSETPELESGAPNHLAKRGQEHYLREKVHKLMA